MYIYVYIYTYKVRRHCTLRKHTHNMTSDFVPHPTVALPMETNANTKPKKTK